MKAIYRVVLLVLLALIVLSDFVVLELLFFIPIVGWYIWALNDKNKALEDRVATLEGTHKPKPGQS
jgi:hypothetical protein